MCEDLEEGKAAISRGPGRWQGVRYGLRACLTVLAVAVAVNAQSDLVKTRLVHNGTRLRAQDRSGKAYSCGGGPCSTIATTSTKLPGVPNASAQLDRLAQQTLGLAKGSPRTAAEQSSANYRPPKLSSGRQPAINFSYHASAYAAQAGSRTSRGR